MANKILIVLEQREGNIKRASFEAVTFSAKIAAKLKYEVEAVVVGNDINNLSEVSKYGISKIIHFKNSELEKYSSTAYSDAISDYAKEVDAEYIIIANTAFGRDLAPSLAVKTDAGILTDCIKIEISDGEAIVTRPVYGAKGLIDVKFKSVKKVITTRPNVFKAEVDESAVLADVVIKELSSPNLKCRVVDTKKSEGKLDVAEADIIVSGGRGIKGPENFSLIENLADVLGAAVGASRAVVDAGWRPHREQVGQTGKTVSPSLYVACGISGAIQHLAGMSSSKYIVAINKDKDAPIFSIADYGIAGDVFEILPALTEEIRKYKS
ncbi:MAG: electron transfer flavoprotein subunit alpha/FixB family protein [Ignavibacteriaceae bacterium]|nr:electron transfer flavoprotein subunit alpha/FixB family protein [Ignavibacteriaceae bacterium]